MKKILLLAGIVSLAACTNDPEETFSQGGGSSAGVKVIYDAEGAVEGQLIVKFRPSAADSLAAALASASATRAGFATADELLAAVGVDGIRPLFGSDPRFEERHRAFGLHQWYVVTFDESLPLREMVGELSHDGRIEVLEYARCPRLKNRFPARPLRSAAAAATRASMPMNDPLLPAQWHYDNTGYQVLVTQAGADVNLFDAWKKNQGSSDIVVAVIDQAVQYTHPDLQANICLGQSQPDERRPARIQLRQQHGGARLVVCGQGGVSGADLLLQRRPRNACGRYDRGGQRQRSGRLRHRRGP